jgi:hypothetical protein
LNAASEYREIACVAVYPIGNLVAFLQGYLSDRVHCRQRVHMQKTRRPYLVGLLLAMATAGVAIYLFRRNQPLPQGPMPPAMRASSTEAVSKKQGDAARLGNKQVAEPKIYSGMTGSGLDARTLVACRKRLLQKEELEPINCDAIGLNDQEQHSLCLRQQVQYDKFLQRIAAEAASCPSGVANAAQFYSELRELALAGDIGAQRCFIQGHFNYRSELGKSSAITEEQSNEYPTLAKQFIDAAFERGDWKVIRWLGKTRVSIEDGLVASVYPMGLDHAETQYKMDLLMLFGLGPNAIDRQFRSVGDVVGIFKSGRGGLSTQQLKEGEEWARDMYRAHFVGIPDVVNGPDDADCM